MSSSSFFLKGKPKSAKKRKMPLDSKFGKKNELPKPPKVDQTEDDEEIHSSDEDEENMATEQFSEVEDEEIAETPQDKRLKLAKLYLEEIEKEEKSRAEDRELLENNVSQRLTDEYLDSIGKLRRKVAETYTGYDEKNIVQVKHKLHQLPVTCVCLTADNKFLFTGNKSAIVLKWNCDSMKVIGNIDCNVGKSVDEIENSKKKRRPQTYALAVTTDGKFLAIGDMSPYIQIWCCEKLTHLQTFKGHRDIVTSLVFRKDTHDLYSASRDRSVKIWSLDEMAYVETLYGHQSAITCIDALSRERAITAGGSDRSVRIWKIVEESQLVYNGHSGSIDIVKLINEENFISAGDDGTLCLWSAMKKKALCSKELAHGKSDENDQANWISAVATLINTDIIASGSCDGVIRLWKLGENYREMSLLFEVPVRGFVNSLAFTNDGTKLIAAVGQEHRLGRWWRIKEAKNSIIVIPLLKKSS
ncbi:U3 small nucleolar RNA-interacting protein 2 [Contarinia nasturtii]|uniref:U3 small nucleolar RNA-interacting protein 2 n=1 Tax=Contarinia nasturtii TaxID=265458 RepID=UPI0012D3D968|nr:U3 small nucleolar RNA-interacting protein 2 [Contarinia nasturtii]